MVLALLLVGVALWFGWRKWHVGQSSGVTDLLPAETLMLVHLPDVNRTRDEWHRSDLYALWREPEVQAFLQKPLAKIPPNRAWNETRARLTALEPKDAFLAITSLAGNDPKFAAGFRFRGHNSDVEALLADAKARLFAAFPAGKRETVSYSGHELETFTTPQFALAFGYDGAWWFASNDLASLKAVLDRADRRVTDRKTALTADANFAGARQHMPASYAGFVYVRPQPFLQKLLPLLEASGQSIQTASWQKMQSIQSFAATTSFAGGKMRDVQFVGVPESAGTLERASLRFTTKETLLYFTTLLSLPALPPTPATGNAEVMGIERVLAQLAALGITMDDFKAAFTPELALIGDWSTNAQMPSLLGSLPVKDAAKARKILSTLAGGGSQTGWTQTEANGATIYSFKATSAGFLTLQPIIAVSDKALLAGLDRATVDAALQRTSDASAQLASVPAYETAARAVPAPSSAFGYFDAKTIVERIDAAVRPLLVMSAAFVPGINDQVDLKKLPNIATISRHLSPVVLSTSYQKDGYVSESIGPFTFTQGAAVFGIAAGAAFIQFQRMSGLFGHGSATPSPTPSATPADQSP